MAYTVENMEMPAIKNPTGPAEFNLPVREFVGYDPNGKTDITNSPINREQKIAEVENAKQAGTTEAVVETPAQEESVQLAPQISALARKEQAQRKREHMFAQREKEFEAKIAEADKFAQLKAKIAAKDYSAADELGLTYQEYTEYLLNNKTEISPEEQRYKSLEERQQALEKAQEEQTIKDYQHNQLLWKQEITKIVDENPEFLSIKEMGYQEAVLQLVNDSFDEDGIELTAEQAAKYVEEELVKRAEKLSTLTKIKDKTVEAPKVLGAPKSSPKTITQSMTVTSTQPSKKPLHLMSESEQWEEATKRYLASRQGR